VSGTCCWAFRWWFELFRGDYRSCAMFNWWKKKIYIYILCVPHKNNCKKKIGSHDMKQTDSSIIIVRNVCVLTVVPLLSYSCMFQVEICSQQLEICKSVCMFIVLAIIVENDSLSVVLFRCLPIITSWRKVWTDDCWSIYSVCTT
jgi:hypothetical protein